MSGAYDIVVAAGVEVMSRVTMGSSIGKDSGFRSVRASRHATNPSGPQDQGIGAEMIADHGASLARKLDASPPRAIVAPPKQPPKVDSSERSCRFTCATRTGEADRRIDDRDEAYALTPRSRPSPI